VAAVAGALIARLGFTPLLGVEQARVGSQKPPISAGSLLGAMVLPAEAIR
jgi:hypothetical protein